jgi:DNA-binding FadR family transcriptional regulator
MTYRETETELRVDPRVVPLDALQPVQSVQLYQEISKRLIQQIRSGNWLPGQRLPPERELASSLNVSRPSLREALAALQLRGVVETRQGAASRVTDQALEILGADGPALSLDEDDVSPIALLEVREALEPAIASLAASRFEPDPELERYLRIMAENNDAGRGDRAAWCDADRLFHRRIATHTHNAVFIQFADFVAAVMGQPLWQKLRDEMLAVPGRLESSAAEHQRILDALRRGHSAASAAHAQEHIREIRTYMGLDLG